MALTTNNIGDNQQIPGSASEAYIPDQLIAGDFKLVTDNVLLLAGTAYKRGQVIGIVTASGKGIVSVRTAVDGSQTPVGILADSPDLSSAGPMGSVDGNGGIYLTGEFNQNVVTASTLLDASWSVAQIKAALRPLSIFLKTAVSAADPT